MLHHFIIDSFKARYIIILFLKYPPSLLHNMYLRCTHLRPLGNTSGVHTMVGVSLSNFVRVWPFVIAWLDSSVALDTCDSRLICGAPSFLCCFSHCFASRYAVCLHHCTVSRLFAWLDPWDMRLHADVPEVSQK